MGVATVIFWFVCPWKHRFAVDYDTMPGKQILCPGCGTYSCVRLHVGDCPMTNSDEKARTSCVCEHHDEDPTYLEGGGGKQIELRSE